MDIPEPVLKRLLAVFQSQPAIERVYLFGSRARGEHRPNSDIDLALQGVHIRPSARLDIQEAAGLYKVDFVDLTDELDDSFKQQLGKEAVLLYEKETTVTPRPLLNP